VTIAHLILAQATDSDPGTWWWIVGSLVLVLMAAFYFFNYFLLVRLPLWILRHTLYRVHIHGAENIPAAGPALVVSNHVSHIDALLIMLAQKRRIRFMIWAPFLGIPFLRWLLRFLRVIPIDGSKGPRAIIQALRQASDALAAGDVVCIFAEGGITRTGFLLPFHRGMEQIVKRTPVPIIPVCLDHVWGSIFSYHGGRFFWKLPQRIPYHVHVSFGPALPATASSFEVRQAIQRLWAETAVRRARKRRPVHLTFLRQAVRHPFRSCFIDTSNAASPIMKYGMALAGAKILARHLRPVLKDDAMVGLWLPPSAGGALANVAVAFLGKTAVNLNYSSTQDIVQSSIRQCGIKHVLTSRLFLHKVALDPGPGVELVYLEDFRKQITKWERLRTFAGVLLVPGFIQEKLTRWQSDKPVSHPAEDVVTIIFSSGSTGDPKGAMLSHANIAANVESMVQAVDIKPSDCLLGILPFFHSFGYTVTLWAPLQVGASSVFYPNPLQAREIGEVSKKYQATLFLSTPTFLRSYLRRCERDNFRSVRILMCGAEKLPQSLAKEFKEKFNVLPLEGYGCTELSPAVAANVPDWQQDNMRQIGNKPGTIGQPLPGIAVRVVHKETMQDLPAGQEGMLLVYGANVMKGYLGRDDLTQKKIVQGGWYITGDLAMLDEDGFITITGREERFAKVGGEMVPLEKLEEEIHAALKSNDRLVAVTAIPDVRKGERLIVLHVAIENLNVQQVNKALGERGLPNIYIPGQKDWFQVEHLPILGSGKLDLKKCKQMAQDLAKGSGEGE
jgi:acyl-[acyl-carrier-protein]-phospholipid O-acyltransferase/long-chain-fatty-acid--[acyl-carrier-protein] ligase